MVLGEFKVNWQASLLVVHNNFQPIWSTYAVLGATNINGIFTVRSDAGIRQSFYRCEGWESRGVSYFFAIWYGVNGFLGQENIPSVHMLPLQGKITPGWESSLQEGNGSSGHSVARRSFPWAVALHCPQKDQGVRRRGWGWEKGFFLESANPSTWWAERAMRQRCVSCREIWLHSMGSHLFREVFHHHHTLATLWGQWDRSRNL